MLVCLVFLRMVGAMFFVLQGHEIEMCDPDYTGFKYIGTLQGTKVACHCGCERTLPGAAWLFSFICLERLKKIRSDNGAGYAAETDYDILHRLFYNSVLV